MLGLNPTLIIETMAKPYLDTLPVDEAKAYVNDMVNSVGPNLQGQIDALENKASAAKTKLTSVISQIPAFVAGVIASIAVPPAALSLKSDIANMKVSVNDANLALQEVSTTVSRWGIPTPPGLSTVIDMVNTASNLINTIPSF